MDKLTVIQNALVATGNNRINVLNDGSDEWYVADTGFGRAIKFLTSRHNWPFATSIEKLGRVPDVENLSQRFRDNGFRLPTHYHLVEVYHDGVIFTDYEVMGGILSCDFGSEVFAKLVSLPAEAAFPPYAEEILTLMVESACYAGLNEDPKERDTAWQKAENLLFESRPRADQNNPARNAYKSSIATARRTRRR